jgi:hypothetical protein
MTSATLCSNGAAAKVLVAINKRLTKFLDEVLQGGFFVTNGAAAKELAGEQTLPLSLDKCTAISDEILQGTAGDAQAAQQFQMKLLQGNCYNKWGCCKDYAGVQQTSAAIAAKPSYRYFGWGYCKELTGDATNLYDFKDETAAGTGWSDKPCDFGSEPAGTDFLYNWKTTARLLVVTTNPAL